MRSGIARHPPLTRNPYNLTRLLAEAPLPHVLQTVDLAARLDHFERLLQVLEDVVGVFDADGEAHQRVLDAQRQPLLGRLVPVADNRGLLDQALDAAEADGAM